MLVSSLKTLMLLHKLGLLREHKNVKYFAPIRADLYQNMSPDIYPRIRELACHIMSMFGSAYRYEQLLQQMGYAMCYVKKESRFTDSHLFDILHITADKQSDCQMVCTGQQCQPSHCCITFMEIIRKILLF